LLGAPGHLSSFLHHQRPTIFRYIDGGRLAHLLLGAVCLGLVFLTRNDSLIFAILLFGYLFVEFLLML
jgi:predicted membrane-bound mannosyltransferase